MTFGRLLPSPLRPLLALAAYGLSFGAGCNSDGTAEVSVTHPTMIEVAPETFLGNVPCTETEGGLTRYVATIEDLDGNFFLPSSRPTPCLAGVGFGLVVPGRSYKVYVDGYDTALLSPRAPGSRLMVAVPPRDPSGGQTDDDFAKLVASAEGVERAWSTECPTTTSVSLTIVRAADCAPLVPENGRPPAPTELRVPTKSLLGELVCGDEAGQVERLSVSVTLEGEETRTVEMTCAEATDAVLSDVAAGKRASIYVAAYEPDSGRILAGAQCQAVTVAGASVSASCAKLSQVGTVRVDLAAALNDVGLACSAASVDDVRVAVGKTAGRSFPPPSCLQPFDYGFTAEGTPITVTALDESGSALALLSCFAEVVPGQVTLATCEPIDGP